MTTDELMARRVALWDTINRYAEACGGDTSSKTAGRVARQRAVIEVERIALRALESTDG